MLDYAYLYGLMLLSVCGNGARMFGLWARPKAQRSLVLWCSRMKCLSLVETEITKAASDGHETVTHSLLWPELKDCDQRCVH